MLSRQFGQYFRGVPLPIQWKFIMCILPHSGHMHSTFALSKLTTSSSSSSGFSIGISCSLDAFRLSDDIFKNPAQNEIKLNETGDTEIRWDRPGVALEFRKRMGFKLYPRKEAVKPPFWHQPPSSSLGHGIFHYRVQI